MAGRAARYAVEELYKLSQPTLKKLFGRGKRPVTRDPNDLGSHYTEVEVDPLKWQELMVERNYPHSIPYNLENIAPPRGLSSGSPADYSLRKLRNFGKWLGDNPKEAVRTPSLNIDSRGFPDQPGGRHRAFTSAIIEEPSMSASIPINQLQRFRDSDLLTVDVPFSLRSAPVPKEGWSVEDLEDLILPPKPRRSPYNDDRDKWDFVNKVRNFMGTRPDNENWMSVLGLDDDGLMAGGMIYEDTGKDLWGEYLGSMRRGGGTQILKSIFDEHPGKTMEFVPTPNYRGFYKSLGAKPVPKYKPDEVFSLKKPFLRGMAPLGALPLLENEE